MNETDGHPAVVRDSYDHRPEEPDVRPRYAHQSTFYDSFGNVHRSRLEIEGEVLKWAGDRTRCTVTLADGQTQVAHHEASPDGHPLRVGSMFDVPELEELPEDLRSRIKEVEEKSGFVPNIFLSLARRPAEWRAFFAYHDALMDKETPALSKGDRELIVVATSAENHCLYCVVAHGAIARIRTRNPRIADQVATDWRTAELDDRQRAILEVAVRIAVEPWTVSDDLLGSLRAHGLTDDDIWDVGSISSFFAMSNRLAHFTKTLPNEEFYLMGRVPRTP